MVLIHFKLFFGNKRSLGIDVWLFVFLAHLQLTDFVYLSVCVSTMGPTDATSCAPWPVTSLVTGLYIYFYFCSRQQLCGLVRTQGTILSIILGVLTVFVPRYAILLYHWSVFVPRYAIGNCNYSVRPNLHLNRSHNRLYNGPLQYNMSITNICILHMFNIQRWDSTCKNPLQASLVAGVCVIQKILHLLSF